MDFLLQSNSYKLFEEMAAAVNGWNLDFVQLSGAEGAAQLQQLGTSNMLFSKAQLSAKFEQRGGPNKGWRTFALMAPSCSELKWCMQGITKRSLMVFPKNGDFSSVSQPGFNMHTISFSEKLLQRTANLYFHKNLNEFLTDQRKVVHCSPDNASTLNKYFAKLCWYIGMGSELLPSKEVDGIETDLCMQILNCLESSPSRWQPTKPTKRNKSMNDSLDIINSLPASSVNVPLLVESCGVSIRTLEYAFLDHFSVTPQRYLKALKLRKVHFDLRKARRGNQTSVASIALANGFDMTGQFAQDYSTVYGELPSATLRHDC